MATDGVTEAFNQEEERFGRKRLAASFSESRHLSLTEVVRQINETLVAYRDGSPQFDDVTVVLVEFEGQRPAELN